MAITLPFLRRHILRAYGIIVVFVDAKIDATVEVTAAGNFEVNPQLDNYMLDPFT